MYYINIICIGQEPHTLSKCIVNPQTTELLPPPPTGASQMLYKCLFWTQIPHPHASHVLYSFTKLMSILNPNIPPPALLIGFTIVCFEFVETNCCQRHYAMFLKCCRIFKRFKNVMNGFLDFTPSPFRKQIFYHI